MAEPERPEEEAEDQELRSQLSDADVERMREIYIPINLKSLWDLYYKPLYQYPYNTFIASTRWTERQTKNWMTGKAALVTMPASIMVRNAAHCAHDSAKDNRFMYSSSIVGLAGVAASSWYAGSAVYDYLTTTDGPLSAIAATTGEWGALSASAAAGALTILPAFTVASLGCASVIGGIAFALSTVPAVANMFMGPAWHRTKQAWKGVDIDEQVLQRIQEKFEADSLDNRYEAVAYRDVTSSLGTLTTEHRRAIFEKLNEEFGEQAAASPALTEEQQHSRNTQRPSTGGPAPGGTR